jgi:hypothetical protein
MHGENNRKSKVAADVLETFSKQEGSAVKK